MKEAAVGEDAVEVEEAGSVPAGNPSDSVVTGIGDSHGAGWIRATWASEASNSAASWRSRVRSR